MRLGGGVVGERHAKRLDGLGSAEGQRAAVAGEVVELRGVVVHEVTDRDTAGSGRAQRDHDVSKAI